jgi:hypothetical protein
MNNITTLEQYLAVLRQIIELGAAKDWLTPTNILHLSQMVAIKQRRHERKKQAVAG